MGVKKPMYSLLCPWTINLTAGYRKGKATSKRGFLWIGKVTCILFVYNQTAILSLQSRGISSFTMASIVPYSVSESFQPESALNLLL